MLNKILSLIMVFMLFFTFPVSVLADENESTTDSSDVEEDQDSADESEENSQEENSDGAEVEITTDAKAKLHLAKLARGIELRVQSATFLVGYFEANGYEGEVDLDLLNSKIDELTAILEEIENMDLETESDVVGSAHQLHDDAVHIVNEIKTEARNADLTDEEKKEIKAEFKVIKDEVFGEYKQKANNRINKFAREHNEQILRGVLAHIGENNPEILEKIKSGEIDVQEVIAKAKQRFNNLEPREKVKVLKKLKEEHQERKEFAKEKRKDSMDKHRMNRDERIKNRLDKHKDRVKQRVDMKHDRVKERVEIRKERINDRIGDRKERVNDKREEIRDKRVNRIDSEVSVDASVEVNENE